MFNFQKKRAFLINVCLHVYIEIQWHEAKNSNGWSGAFLPADEEEIKFGVLILRWVGIGVQVTGLLNGEKLSIVRSETHAAVWLPVESEESVARGPLSARLDTASGFERPVFVLHCADEPTLGGLIELELERLVVRDLVLVRCQVHTLLHRNVLAVQRRNEWSLPKWTIEMEI